MDFHRSRIFENCRVKLLFFSVAVRSEHTKWNGVKQFSREIYDFSRAQGNVWKWWPGNAGSINMLVWTQVMWWEVLRGRCFRCWILIFWSASSIGQVELVNFVLSNWLVGFYEQKDSGLGYHKIYWMAMRLFFAFMEIQDDKKLKLKNQEMIK